ncbi:hypothetical protein AFCDBAGC_0597 [Methylobacterium cerastii]|uniref:Uncharacterized protein n=1 Tax=Methylobacterium cerastii TaxID=932741 RepID=A0ABQ4QC34_9HYPH|nr:MULTISPECIES: hypothetical protein [Methylobacterium]TXM76769.1 hypothetical protein FV226_00690 [Methylobacterium sp. WL12]TXN84997.1 hypothetical protein FV234_00115 [Methylobacterium sp. WL8]GJD42758.1 hypothetical protein AFCDBAGC_0597 [Methylobacterium cerastii]
MAGFDHILNWRLLSGSHPFPGPDGGTCINEAALVAAGLPYRAIRSSDDCPPCFSRPLAAYALGLNDAMPDAERHRLMAFVLRLSGSADLPAVEIERTVFLALASIRRLLPPLLEKAGLVDLAVLCAAAGDIDEALAAARSAAWQGGARAQAASGRQAWIAGALAAAVSRTATAAIRAADDPRCAAEIAEGAAAFVPGAWSLAVDILDDALGIGRQAPDVDLIAARGRLDAARAVAHA